MEPIRVDRIVHNDKICDRILAESRLAQFVIADFTGQRSSVYFEAGFAIALGRPVIWTCHERERLAAPQLRYQTISAHVLDRCGGPAIPATRSFALDDAAARNGASMTETVLATTRLPQ